MNQIFTERTTSNHIESKLKIRYLITDFNSNGVYIYQTDTILCHFLTVLHDYDDIGNEFSTILNKETLRIPYKSLTEHSYYYMSIW